MVLGRAALRLAQLEQETARGRQMLLLDEPFDDGADQVQLQDDRPVGVFLLGEPGTILLGRFLCHF